MGSASYMDIHDRGDNLIVNIEQFCFLHKDLEYLVYKKASTIYVHILQYTYIYKGVAH